LSCCKRGVPDVVVVRDFFSYARDAYMSLAHGLLIEEREGRGEREKKA
jgi:hypothetical protein